jgi:MscS family membrane protein
MEPAWVEWVPEGMRHATILGIEGWQWVALVALLVASFVLGMGVRLVLGAALGLGRRIKKQEISVGSGRGIKRSITLATASLLWSAALPTLHLAEIPASVFHTVLTVVLVGSVTWLFAAVWEVACDVYEHRSAETLSRRATHLVLPLVRRFVRFVIFVIGGVSMVSSLGYDPSALIAGLGIGGVALALAAKDSVENLFGSLTIVMDMPFQVGDWIKIDKVDGVVEEINLRSTRVRTFDDSLITLPNSNLIKASVENMGARRVRRFRASLLVTGAVSDAQLEGFLAAGRKALSSIPTVRQADASLAAFDFADTGLRVQLTVYLEVATADEELRNREIVILALLKAAGENGVAIGGAVPPAVAS